MPPEDEGTLEQVGTDDSLDVKETVDGIADSLRLTDTPEEGTPPTEGEGKKPEGEAPATPVEGKAPEGQQPPADGKGAPAPVEGQAQQPAIPAQSDVPPDTWRKEAKEAWAALPQTVKAEIAKREGDVARFVGEAQPSFQIAQTVHKTLEPYLPLLQRYGVDPIQHVGALLQAHTTLLFGQPEVKAQMFRNLAQQAGIDLGKLAADPNAAAEANGQQLAYIRSLEERVARMEMGVTGVTTHIQEGRVAELEQGIMAFANDVEQHPFFWELAQTGEIKALIDSGAARTLKDAYELAVYRNPVTRQKQLQLETTRSAAENAKKAAEKAAAARKATGANVRSRGAGRVSSVGMETIDDTLKEKLSEIRSRTH